MASGVPAAPIKQPTAYLCGGAFRDGAILESRDVLSLRAALCMLTASDLI
jgi:hypothetical protein